MRLWPRSLRGRLILTVTLTMVITQSVMLVGASRAFNSLQRVERAGQMARQITFIKPIIERQSNLPQEMLIPEFMELPPIAQSGEHLDAANTLAAPGADSRTITTNPANNSHAPPPDVFQPPFRFMVTKTAPPTSSDADLLVKMREIAPDLEQVVYEETGGALAGGPNRPYELTAWSKLATRESGVTIYLKTIAIQSSHRRLPIVVFPISELLLRGGIGLLLALLITSWIAKPLARLAEAADDTLPNGDVRRGVAPIQTDKQPTEIAHTLAAFERMRGRISTMVVERTTMLTALAHDLRTPITRLMLRLELSSDARLREDAVRDLTKMQTMIARTLDFLRSAEQGQHISKTDLHTAIDAAVTSLGTDAAARVIVRDIDTQHAAPIMANSWGIERMLANVIDNALKYGEHAIVEISSDDSHATISITDNGKGVPTESLARLKEPFYRVDSSRNLDDGGAGLGLSIVDNLVRTYGGEWTIKNVIHEDNANKENIPSGLIVEIRLPIIKASS